MYKNLFHFIYKEIIVQFWFYLLVISSVSLYWVFDINLRNFLMKFIVDSLESHNSVNAFYYFKLFFIFHCLRMLIMRFYNLFWALLNSQMQAHLLRVINLHMFDNANKLFDQADLSLVNKIQMFIQKMPEFIDMIFDNLLANISLLISLGIVFYCSNVVFFYLFLALLFLHFFCEFFLMRMLVAINEKLVGQYIYIMNKMNDIFSNILSVIVINSSKYEMIDMEKNIELYQKIVFRQGILQLISQFIKGIIYLLYFIGTLYYVLISYFNGFMSMGDVALIMSLNKEATERLWYLNDDFNKFYAHYGSLSGVFGEMKNFMQISKKNNLLVDISNYDIVFENIHLKYGNNVVFDNLNLRIPSGQKIGILGESGVGKSSLLKILLRIIVPDNGKLTLGGCDNYEPSKYMSMINQGVVLFDRSIKENIAYNLDVSVLQIEEAAVAAQAHEFIMQTGGYDENASKLSIGQKQRILIARAFLQNKPIFIADEMTSALDQENQAKIYDLLPKLMLNKTCIVITHEYDILKKMDRIVFLKNGAVFADGSYETMVSLQLV